MFFPINAVSAFVKWTAREFQISSIDRIACPSPLGFDLSTFDIFNMALCGATCVLVPDHIVWMPRFLVQFLLQARITCWYSVPSILTGMLQEGRFAEHEYPDLRVILFAGEVFPGPGLARLQAAVPQADLRKSLWPDRDQCGHLVPCASWFRWIATAPHRPRLPLCRRDCGRREWRTARRRRLSDESDIGTILKIPSALSSPWTASGITAQATAYPLRLTAVTALSVGSTGK